jgi:hypothetical protein
VIRAYVPEGDRHYARLQQLEQSIRFFCRTNQEAPNMVWLSARTLANTRLFRGSTETLRLARELADEGHIGRVTARGRGRGKGRTLYFLPSAKKWRVLEELRREDMPPAAIAKVVAFFARRESFASRINVTNGARQQCLGLSTVGTESLKGAPDKPAQRSRAPSVPPRKPPKGTPNHSAPPSTRRLGKHGFALERLQSEQLEAALERMRRAVMRRRVADPEGTTPH